MAVLMFGGLTDSNILVKYNAQENPEFVPELLNNGFYTLLVQCSDMHETYQAETKAMTHKTEACPVITTICTRLSRYEINPLQQQLIHSMTTKRLVGQRQDLQIMICAEMLVFVNVPESLSFRHWSAVRVMQVDHLQQL